MRSDEMKPLRRRVVGGEFEIAPDLLVPQARELTTPRAFASGRAALHAIVADAMDSPGVSHVFLPDYLCGSMISAIDDLRCEYSYYPVGLDLRPDIARLSNDLSATESVPAVILVDYFGLIDLSPEIAVLAQAPNRPVIVLDKVQSFFTFNLDAGADYAFTSLRKTLPTPDGAPVLSRRAELYPQTDAEAPFVVEKLVGNLVKAFHGVECLPDSVYIDHTVHGERLLDSDGYYDCAMSAVSRRILSNVDLGRAARARRRNFDYLAAKLRSSGIAPLVSRPAGATPLFLPVLLEDRDRVRAALAEERIFCPVHWPLPERAAVDLEPAHPELWNHGLSLVVDQRYGEPEMDRIAETVGRVHG